jgi:hypothetical protein
MTLLCEFLVLILHSLFKDAYSWKFSLKAPILKKGFEYRAYQHKPSTVGSTQLFYKVKPRSRRPFYG